MWISCILKNMFFFTWIWTAKTQQNALWKLPIEFWAKKHKLCHAEGFYGTPPLIELCARLLALAMLLASWHLGLIHSNRLQPLTEAQARTGWHLLLLLLLIYNLRLRSSKQFARYTVDVCVQDWLYSIVLQCSIAVAISALSGGSGVWREIHASAFESSRQTPAQRYLFVFKKMQTQWMHIMQQPW